MYIPLVQFVLGGRHEELEKGNQPPCIAREKPVPQPLFDFLDVIDTPNKLVIFIQQPVPLCIQLLHHRCHPAILALPAVCIRQFIVRTPTGCTRTHRAQAIDSHLSTIHAE